MFDANNYVSGEQIFLKVLTYPLFSTSTTTTISSLFHHQKWKKK